MRTTSRSRPSCRGCSATAASTSAPTAASRAPQDLKGKPIGLPEYQITANVWVRGILQDEYGVKPSDIKWRRGGLEEPGRDERAPIKLPPEIDLKAIPTTARCPTCWRRARSTA